MTIGYKLTDAEDRTYNGTQWGPGVTHEAPGEGPLCWKGWVHLYDDPLVAVLLNPIHAGFADPHLWEVEWSGRTLDASGTKRGAQRVTTLRRIDLPEVTTEQRVAFAILCAARVCSDRRWREWAEGWLSGRDRTAEAAEAAKAARAVRARAAAEAARARAAWAAAAEAASAAEVSASAAEWAAWAVEAAERLDLPAIARDAIEGRWSLPVPAVSR